jgi:hypothetical protein
MEASGQIKSHLYDSLSKLHRDILSETNCSNHHDDNIGKLKEKVAPRMPL